MNYQELHYLLLVAGNYSNKAIVKRMRSQNLMPGQPKILDFLLDHDKCTQKEISKGKESADFHSQIQGNLHIS